MFTIEKNEYEYEYKKSTHFFNSLAEPILLHSYISLILTIFTIVVQFRKCIIVSRTQQSLERRRKMKSL